MLMLEHCLHGSFPRLVLERKFETHIYAYIIQTHFSSRSCPSPDGFFRICNAFLHFSSLRRIPIINQSFIQGSCFRIVRTSLLFSVHKADVLLTPPVEERRKPSTFKLRLDFPVSDPVYLNVASYCYDWKGMAPLGYQDRSVTINIQLEYIAESFDGICLVASVHEPCHSLKWHVHMFAPAHAILIWN